MEGEGDCINPAQAYTTLFTPPVFSIVKTVKEASAVCRSFLYGVVIFMTLSSYMNSMSLYVSLCVCDQKVLENLEPANYIG